MSFPTIEPGHRQEHLAIWQKAAAVRRERREVVEDVLIAARWDGRPTFAMCAYRR